MPIQTSPSETPTPLSPLADPRTRRYATLLGVVASGVLSATVVIAGLKAGITPGVSPLVVLLAWAVFARAMRKGVASDVLNLAQVAGSSGVAVTAGVIFTAPLLPILAASQGFPYNGLPLLKLIGAAMAGALLGFGYVGLNARRVLADPSLPAPEARACEAMIRTAAAQAEDAGRLERGTRGASTSSAAATTSDKPQLRNSLIPGLAIGFLAPLIAALGFASSNIALVQRHFSASDRSFSLNLPFMPIYFGIGGLLTLGTAVIAFFGTLTRLAGDLLFAASTPNLAVWPDTTMRWVGGGAMTVAVLWSVVRVVQLTKAGKEGTLATINPATLVISARAKRWLWVSIIAGTLMLVGGIVALGEASAFTLTLALSVSLLAAFMVALGALLSLQIGSSASPVSGTVFLMTLILCGIALAFGRGGTPADLELMMLILVAACVAVCSSNDASQDYRTLQLCDVPVERGFFGQALGLMTAAVIVPVVVYLAEQSYGLGSAALPAPQGQLFATLVEGMLFHDALPLRPIAVGLGIGVVAVVVERVAQRRGWLLPAMAFAVGLYLPPELGVGLLLGALARYLGDRAQVERSASILAAGGLITGAAAFDIVLGVAMLAGVSLDALAVVALPALVMNVVAFGGIALILWLLWSRARPAAHTE